MAQPNSTVPATPERLRQFAFAFAPAVIIDAAAQYHLFDILNDGPRDLDQLMAGTGASVRALRYVLNALVGIGLLGKDANGQYSLTPESATFLISNKPTYYGNLFRQVCGQIIPDWLHLPEVLETGRPVVSVNHEESGTAFFRDFVEALFAVNYPAAQFMASALGIAKSTRPISVLDLAAGSGVWSIALAERCPNVRVKAVDFPEVLSVTGRVAKRHGVADRFDYVAGDLAVADFDMDHNIVICGYILAALGERRSRTVLQKAFTALASGGTLIIAEWIVNDTRTAPPNALVFAVHMLVHSPEGDTFSFKEIREWLEDVGFEAVRLVEVPMTFPLIFATKPERKTSGADVN